MRISAVLVLSQAALMVYAQDAFLPDVRVTLAGNRTLELASVVIRQQTQAAASDSLYSEFGVVPANLGQPTGGGYAEMRRCLERTSCLVMQNSRDNPSILIFADLAQVQSGDIEEAMDRLKFHFTYLNGKEVIGWSKALALGLAYIHGERSRLGRMEQESEVLSDGHVKHFSCMGSSCSIVLRNNTAVEWQRVHFDGGSPKLDSALLGQLEYLDKPLSQGGGASFYFPIRDIKMITVPERPLVYTDQSAVHVTTRTGESSDVFLIAGDAVGGFTREGHFVWLTLLTDGAGKDCNYQRISDYKGSHLCYSQVRSIEFLDDPGSLRRDAPISPRK